MPQAQFPFFPVGVTHVTSMLAFSCEEGKVTYFTGNMPVFVHDESDRDSYRMITAQFCVNGHAKQMDIVRAFGVSKISVKRAVKIFREEGPRGFFKEPNRRGPAVLTDEIVKQAQQLLDEGLDLGEVARRLALKHNTLYKAARIGKLHASSNKKEDAEPAPTKSARTEEDRAAPMGVGATHVEERIAASKGELQAVPPRFEQALDVPNGGVLLALPALLALGLLETTERFFAEPKGYYGLDSLFLLLALMALARQTSLESMRYCAPGEWGNLLGLDRIPEVRTLRNKLHFLAREGQPQQWSAELCRQWMEAAPEQAGTLYIDGHVRVYNGDQTPLPRHYVARQKLCQRATTDYWVNAMDGQPFFFVNQAVDPGLIQVLEHEIVPRLEREVPQQPTPQQLEADPLLHRFTLVFDREGYSPAFLKRMKEKRIACLTYHKHPGEDWAEEEFQLRTVKLVTGQTVEMRLAERGTCLSNGLWVREIRKLTTRGHQTSILSTDYRSDIPPIAGAMFARWSQENFFRYSRQHFGIDKLADYSLEEISDPTPVVNPAWRELDCQVRSLNGRRSRHLANFAALNLDAPIEPEKMEPFMRRKAELQEEIERMDREIETLKRSRRETPHHIDVSDLPPEQQFKKLATASKHLIDTIKMVAYRAETAMANILRSHQFRADEARQLLASVYRTEADLLPNPEAGTLTVRLHHLPTVRTDTIIQKLCEELNDTKTIFPRTNLRLIFKVGSSQNPRDQEV
jgi:transposase